MVVRELSASKNFCSQMAQLRSDSAALNVIFGNFMPRAHAESGICVDTTRWENSWTRLLYILNCSRLVANRELSAASVFSAKIAIITRSHWALRVICSCSLCRIVLCPSPNFSELWLICLCTGHLLLLCLLRQFSLILLCYFTNFIRPPLITLRLIFDSNPIHHPNAPSAETCSIV